MLNDIFFAIDTCVTVYHHILSCISVYQRVSVCIIVYHHVLLKKMNIDMYVKP